VLRADANRRIGAGHLMRCLALAQEWRHSGGTAAFAGSCESPALRDRIESAGFDFLNITPGLTEQEDSRALLQLTAGADRRQTPIVLDGYDFGEYHQRAVRSAGHPLVVIDDMAHLEFYHANAIVNQNVDARALPYHGTPETLMLLGPEYVLLRDEFRRWREPVAHGESDPAGKSGQPRVLITMGASDPVNATLAVAEAVADSPIRCKVVVGPTSRWAETLRARFHDREHIELISNPGSMPQLMDWADVAITAGGSTCYELAFMGVPALIVTIARNQYRIARGLDEQGVARHLGDARAVSAHEIASALHNLLHNDALRRMMSGRGRELVDGLGSSRVVSAINGLDHAPS
jgi:UDP-2,4-diacetamido-2,4,6-trideoxy-beta-L-altropyranose hydrolase